MGSEICLFCKHYTFRTWMPVPIVTEVFVCCVEYLSPAIMLRDGWCEAKRMRQANM